MLMDRTTASTTPPAARPRHRVLRWVLALFCLVAVSAGAVLVAAGLQQHPPPPAPSAQHPFSLSPAQAQAKAQAGDPGTGTAEPAAVPSKPRNPALPSVLVPNHLYIPSLGVNAPLDPEPITKEGDFVVPPNVARVGLSSAGATLAAPDGTVLAAGHVNDYNQGYGALYQLSTIQPGALVVVTGNDGSPTRWVTDALANVNKSVLPQDIFDAHGERRLVLVTCGGKILTLPNGAHTYADNIVVSAAPVQPAPTGFRG